MENWKYNIKYDCEISTMGNCRNAKTKKLFAAKTNRMYLRNHKGKIHRMVAETFLDNPLNLPEVNHKNGDKHNNRLENLEWCTKSQNEKHKVLIGLHNTAKLTKELVEQIRNEYKPRVVSTYTLAKRYNVAQGTIHQLLKNKTWI
jgi:ribosomal protein S25